MEGTDTKKRRLVELLSYSSHSKTERLPIVMGDIRFESAVLNQSLEDIQFMDSLWGRYCAQS